MKAVQIAAEHKVALRLFRKRAHAAAILAQRKETQKMISYFH
jgi:hypothetical protein